VNVRTAPRQLLEVKEAAQGQARIELYTDGILIIQSEQHKQRKREQN
jgi:hypothetical protein